MKKLKITVYIVLFVFVGCEKEENHSSDIPTFSGYTATDIFGVPMGLTDTTDWTNDDVWLAVEKKLFANYESYINNCFFDSKTSIYPSYPNPTVNRLFYISVIKDSNTMYMIRVVNKHFDKLILEDSISRKTIIFNLTGLTQDSDTMLRAYYMFIRNDSCLYKGHGDIKIN